MIIDEIKKYQIFSAIFVCILGTFLHFTYKISGENKLVASFSAVNESVWEHLKLLYFPMLITTIMGYFYIEKNCSNSLCAKTLGIITSILFVIGFFYTYSGIIGKSIVFVDILSFFVAATLGEYVAFKIMTSNFECNNLVAIISLIALFIGFILFTYTTPELGIFKDPVTGKYGIIKNI